MGNSIMPGGRAATTRYCVTLGHRLLHLVVRSVFHLHHANRHGMLTVMEISVASLGVLDETEEIGWQSG